jgi:hypothetical protein
MTTSLRTAAALGLALLLAGAAIAGGPEISIDTEGFQSASELGFSTLLRPVATTEATETEILDIGQTLMEPTGKPITIKSLQADADGDLYYVDAKDPSCSYYFTPSTGDISFFVGTADYEGSGDTPGLPGDDAAAELALMYLEQLGMMPDHPEQMVLAKVTTLRMAEATQDGSRADFAKMVSVYFSRQIEGVPVTGPGSKMIVHLGENGILTGLTRRWTEVEPVATESLDLLGTEQVLDQVHTHLAREWSAAAEIHAETPVLVYYDDGHGWLEPAYAVVADVSHRLPDGSLTHAPALEIVPALKRPQAQYAQQEKAPVAPATDSPPQG